MASVSLDVVRGANYEEPYIHAGTNAPGHGDLEVRIDKAKGWTTLEVADALRGIVARIENGSYNDINNV